MPAASSLPSLLLVLPLLPHLLSLFSVPGSRHGFEPCRVGTPTSFRRGSGQIRSSPRRSRRREHALPPSALSARHLAGDRRHAAGSARLRRLPAGSHVASLRPRVHACLHSCRLQVPLLPLFQRRTTRSTPALTAPRPASDRRVGSKAQQPPCRPHLTAKLGQARWFLVPLRL
ncbi:uncharacterized protein LOC125553851 isoform X2 [Triticum urartu]|uniref:uncharacterized protein LOC125553851 isoform X2 n=1 Tax=Triticum urartu TaxID=4572 RepID=UPI0020432EBC|nr:uncharacterized protein LOC125553851 isoform X2 [Triticum urartu]